VRNSTGTIFKEKANNFEQNIIRKKQPIPFQFAFCQGLKKSFTDIIRFAAVRISFCLLKQTMVKYTL
jgi:hypothetical protein